jgi:hypothetical protein
MPTFLFWSICPYSTSDLVSCPDFESEPVSNNDLTIKEHIHATGLSERPFLIVSMFEVNLPCCFYTPISKGFSNISPSCVVSTSRHRFLPKWAKIFNSLLQNLETYQYVACMNYVPIIILRKF